MKEKNFIFLRRPKVWDCENHMIPDGSWHAREFAQWKFSISSRQMKFIYINADIANYTRQIARQSDLQIVSSVFNVHSCNLHIASYVFSVQCSVFTFTLIKYVIEKIFFQGHRFKFSLYYSTYIYYKRRRSIFQVGGGGE